MDDVLCHGCYKITHTALIPILSRVRDVESDVKQVVRGGYDRAADSYLAARPQSGADVALLDEFVRGSPVAGGCWTRGAAPAVRSRPRWPVGASRSPGWISRPASCNWPGRARRWPRWPRGPGGSAFRRGRLRRRGVLLRHLPSPPRRAPDGPGRSPPGPAARRPLPPLLWEPRQARRPGRRQLARPAHVLEPLRRRHQPRPGGRGRLPPGVASRRHRPHGPRQPSVRPSPASRQPGQPGRPAGPAASRASRASRADDPMSPVDLESDAFGVARVAANQLAERTGAPSHDVAVILGSGWVQRRRPHGRGGSRAGGARPGRLSGARGGRPRQHCALHRRRPTADPRLSRPDPPLRGPFPGSRRPRSTHRGRRRLPHGRADQRRGRHQHSTTPSVRRSSSPTTST